MTLAVAVNWIMIPSASGERHILPRQTMRIFIVLVD